MNLIPGNIFIILIKRSFYLFCIIFFFCVTGHAQHAPATDTVVISAHDDTSGETEQSGTGYEPSDYFDHYGDGTTMDSIHIRRVSDRLIDSLKKDDAFWYADKVFKKKKGKVPQNVNSKMPTQWMNMTMLVVIVVIFIGLLGWYLFQNNIIRRKQRVAREKQEETISEENIFDIDYQKEIERAIRGLNYRLATRLLFLRLLKNLSQKNIIQYKQDRTNFDYLLQLSQGKYYHDFFRLTRNYEYAWYGKFEVSQEAFGVIKNEFEKFDRTVS